MQQPGKRLEIGKEILIQMTPCNILTTAFLNIYKSDTVVGVGGEKNRQETIQRPGELNYSKGVVIRQAKCNENTSPVQREKGWKWIHQKRERREQTRASPYAIIE